MEILDKRVLKLILFVDFITMLMGITSLFLAGTYAQIYKEELIFLGEWNEKQLDEIIRKSSEIQELDKRIDFLSGQFLNTIYKESTLIGNLNTPEVFVINLEEMDCFTYIDYVEAMRLSNSFSQFKDNLKKVRYKSGKVAFKNRNHFFTDWIEFDSDHIDDVTDTVGGEKTKTVRKMLNKKENGTYFLPGITVKERKIQYIPSDAIDNTTIERLRGGDYVGIYSEVQGLDVSHTGIIIKDGNKIYLRHASSKEGNRKVVDEDLISYISNKPGLVILRPK
jgi:N-acetylmuramoyl-L-alanine amidase-like protein